MKLKNEYFILRHGETVWDDKIVYPWPDSEVVKLSPKGEKQIKKAVQLLAKEKIDFIYSSDLYRTKQTAEIVARALGIQKILFDKRLRDTYLGPWHDKRKKEFYSIFNNPAKRFRLGPAGGESWNKVRARVKSFITAVEKKYIHKRILIVSHGDPLWLLQGVVNNLSTEQLLKIIVVETTNIKKGELRKL